MDVEEYLSKFYENARDPKLSAIKFLLKEFNHPEKDLKFIHIAGTNGKGSCAEMLNNVLSLSKYKVGKFIGPHLIKYNERISINNKNITDKELEDIISRLNPKIEYFEKESNIKLGFFALMTVIAIIYFKENNCDFVVLETGVGGLLDSTNIVNPLISIISSIGLDHMKLLGNTIEKIAEQKAGIIKENSQTVYVEQSEENVNNIIKNTCILKNNNLHLIKEDDIKNYSYNKDYQKFDYKNFKDILVNLKGKKQIYNASIIIECCSILNQKGYEIKEENIRKGLKTVVHRARFETLCDSPKIIFDGAHNKPAIENFMNTTDMYYKNEEKVFIVSILKKKDYEEILKLLVRDKNNVYIFTDGNDKEKYASKDVLLKIAKELTNEKNLYTLDLNDAINLVKSKYKDKVCFVVGSFYTYADVIKMINNF